MSKIVWETSWDIAFEKAKKENKPVLIEFFNPGCIGCQQMDAVVYPVKEIIDFIMNEMIPLRIPVSNEEMIKKFDIKWTPTLIVIDVNEKEHQRTVGFMAADELIPSLLLGKAKIYFDLENYPKALEIFQKIIDNYPKSNDAPEAIFLSGVAGYKNTHQVVSLKEAHNLLNKNYPETTWAKRAYPYSLL